VVIHGAVLVRKIPDREYLLPPTVSRAGDNPYNPKVREKKSGQNIDPIANQNHRRLRVRRE
jgi:hypothetical protein